MLIAQPDMIAVAESIEFHRGAFLFETEETARHLGMGPFLLEDAARDHYSYYRALLWVGHG